MNEPRQIDDGGPAFPSDNFGQPSVLGMSLRDWFAGMAMQGLISCHGDPRDRSEMATRAYASAEAMLAARKEAR